MVLFLSQSRNIKPSQWGSDVDVQYAVQKNAEKIYGINPENILLAMPMWEESGNVAKDYSIGKNNGTVHGATWTPQKLNFDGTNDYTDLDNIGSFKTFVGSGPFTINIVVKTNLAAIRSGVMGDWNAIGNGVSFSIEFGGWLQPVNHITTLMRQGDPNAGYLDSGVVYNTSTEYNITVTYDGITRSIFIQGNLKNSDIPPAWIDVGAALDTTIGRLGAFAAGYLNGYIKRATVIKGAITTEQAALFNDLPYGLYQPVSEEIYLMPSTPTIGWTGKINAITNPAKINGVSVANISKVMRH